jgi:hypothetical protein
VRDDDVRSSCFAALDVLQAQHGPELPWPALAAGFAFRGRRVRFLNRAYGIYRAADVQRGPAALTINSAFARATRTSARSTRISSGVSPDREVRVSRRLPDDEDGPMLERLRGFHGRPIVMPSRRTWQPDRERLAARFERFLGRG